MFSNHRYSFVCAVLLSMSTALPGAVVINEIHFDPPNKTQPEEFIELFNSGGEEVDISGWFFSSGIEFVFPQNTVLASGGFLVVAESPEALLEAFGVEALGPWTGRLDNEGERVVLRDADGGIRDRVDYGDSFPWPIATGGKGSSLELVNPSLDNDLAGSWRPSGLVERPFRERVWLLRAESTEWRYRKGTSEASDPIEAWREQTFVEDDTWMDGQTSIGFGDDDDNTVLEDMRRTDEQEGYTTVFMRHTFEVERDADGELPRKLIFRVFSDDGAFFWINGALALGHNTRTDPPAFDSRARTAREARWLEVEVTGTRAFLLEGENQLAVMGMNSSPTSADFSFDTEIFVPGTEDEDPNALEPPSPGLRNSVFAPNAPPQIRQVDHEPDQPTSAEPFVISARVTDPQGVRSVVLSVQEVLPGQYIPAVLPLPHAELLRNARQEREVNPEYENPQSWTDVPMADDGQNGDAVAGDGVYTARFEPLGNRTLFRYRVRATDSEGLAVTVPNRDDPSRNFALFVYDGVPPYQITRTTVQREGVGFAYPTEVMEALPVYILLTRSSDMTHALGRSGAFQIPKSNEAARDKFNWNGTFVYDGHVYDHVTYRLRQANDRYGGSGKRSMRIRFRKGNYLRARDQYGKRYPTRWRTLNTGKMFDNKRVGNFGLTETMNAELWNMVGLPAPWFHTFHFRVIQGAEEAPASSLGQYLGDFWGMFNAIEDYDPRFLDAHNLEDGNLYKLKDAQFNGNDLRRNQGRFAVTTDRDFQNIRANLRPERTVEWLLDHVNYKRWYPYHAVVEGIRHYDFRPADSHSKNRAWYFEPDYEGTEFGRLWTLPWDSDASWGPNWNNGVDYTKNAIFAGGGKTTLKQEYRNYLREFRDLVWTQEVIETMIDDLVGFVAVFSDADRDRYRSAPASAGTQDFGSITTKIRDMKNFAFRGWSGSTGPTVPTGGRARHLENLANAEGDRTRIPATPTITSLAPEGFPIDALVFRSSAFEDPQAEDTFGGVEWRIGEVSDPDRPFDPAERRVYEVPPVWEHSSDEPLDEITIPRTVVVAGHRYRVRVRYGDDTNRWSHWSDPVEFVAGPARAPAFETAALRVTEIMFNPDADSDFEFIEVQNISASAVDLTDVSFVDGIGFDFRDSGVTSLGAGEYVVVVNNLPAFQKRYDTTDMAVAGEYGGRLADNGERIELRFGISETILAFTYDDQWYRLTDGFGLSLVIRDASADVSAWNERSGWKQSNVFWGSPGADDEEEGEGGFQLPGDLTQDGSLNVSDAVALLGHLIGVRAAELPCGDGDPDDDGNHALLDVNGDAREDITDPIHLLNFLFRRGVPPALGAECVRLESCPTACGE